MARRAAEGSIVDQLKGSAFFYVDVARGGALICAVMLEGWREKRGSR